MGAVILGAIVGVWIARVMENPKFPPFAGGLIGAVSLLMLRLTCAGVI